MAGTADGRGVQKRLRLLDISLSNWHGWLRSGITICSHLRLHHHWLLLLLHIWFRGGLDR